MLEINTVSCTPKTKNLEILFSYFEVYASEVAKIRSGGIRNPLLSDLISQYLKQKCSDNIKVVFICNREIRQGVNTKCIIADEGLDLSDINLKSCYINHNDDVVVLNEDSLHDFKSLCGFVKDFMLFPDNNSDQRFTLLMTQPFEPSDDLNFDINVSLCDIFGEASSDGDSNQDLAERDIIIEDSSDSICQDDIHCAIEDIEIKDEEGIKFDDDLSDFGSPPLYMTKRLKIRNRVNQLDSDDHDQEQITVKRNSSASVQLEATAQTEEFYNDNDDCKGALFDPDINENGLDTASDCESSVTDYGFESHLCDGRNIEIGADSSDDLLHESVENEPENQIEINQGFLGQNYFEQDHDDHKDSSIFKVGDICTEDDVNITSVDISEVRNLTGNGKYYEIDTNQSNGDEALKDKKYPSYFEKILGYSKTETCKSNIENSSSSDSSSNKVNLVEMTKNKVTGRTPTPLVELNCIGEEDDIPFGEVDDELFASYTERYVNFAVEFLSRYNDYSHGLRQEIFDNIISKTSQMRKIYISEKDCSCKKFGSLIKYTNESKVRTTLSTLKSSVNYDDNIIVIRESDMKNDDCLIQLFAAIHMQNPCKPMSKPPALASDFGYDKSISSRCANSGKGIICLLAECLCLLLHEPYSARSCKAYGKSFSINCRQGKDPLFFRLAQQLRFIIGDEPFCNILFSNDIGDIERPLNDIIKDNSFIGRFSLLLDKLFESIERYSRFEFNLSCECNGFHREVTLSAKHKEESSVLRAFQDVQSCLLDSYFSAIRGDNCVSWKEVYQNYYICKAFAPLGSCWSGYEKCKEKFRQNVKEMELGKGRFGSDFLQVSREWRDIVKDESKILGRKSRYYLLGTFGFVW